MEELYAAILEAHAAIRPQVRVTPFERSRGLSVLLGCDVWLKCEHVQPTGSFKIRGATNKIRLLSAAARESGVLTASTGNHGQAVARAGALAGIPVTVYLSASTEPVKKRAIEALGARLVIVEGPAVNAELQARSDARTQGKPYISPYNDLDVVAGQGTLGVELSQDAADLAAVFISVGGGGLIGGTGVALERLRPDTRIVGVWPEHSACMLKALEAGRIVDVPELPTLSDGTAGAVEPGAVTFPICQAVIDETVTVTETEIAAAMRHIAESDRWIVEGSAGVALAGLIRRAPAYRGRKVAVVLCGRNIALAKFVDAIGGVSPAPE